MELPALRGLSRLAAAGCALSFSLGVALCLVYGVRDRPLVGDTQLYFYIGERVASGVPPHVSLQDIKTTLAPIVSGMAMKVGRRFGVDDVSSGRVVTIAAAGISTALVFAVALEFTSSALAAGVAAAALLTTHGFFLEATTGSSPKVLMVPLLLAVYLTAARRRWAWCGAAGIAALLTWQPGAVVLGGATLAVLLDRGSRWSDVARLFLGVALMLLTYESYFAWHEALQAQIHQELVLASEASPREFDLWASLWFFVTEARAFQPSANPVPVTFLLVGAATFLWMLARPRRTVEFVRSRPGHVAFWSSAAVGTVFTLLDHQAHPDMMLVQPAFAVACGIGFAALAWLLGRIRGGRALAVSAALAIVVLCVVDARNDARSNAARGPRLSAQQELADLVGVYRDHRGSVWVVGASHLLGLEHADNHVPHSYLAGPVAREVDFSTYRPLRDGKMPEVLLVSRGIFPGMKTWLRTEYEEITPAAFAAQRVRVFGRRQPGFAGPRPVAIANGRKPAAKTAPKPSAQPAKALSSRSGDVR